MLRRVRDVKMSERHVKTSESHLTTPLRQDVSSPLKMCFQIFSKVWRKRPPKTSQDVFTRLFLHVFSKFKTKCLSKQLRMSFLTLYSNTESLCPDILGCLGCLFKLFTKKDIARFLLFFWFLPPLIFSGKNASTTSEETC